MLAAIVEGERGRIQLFAVMLDYPLDASRLRQDQDRQLAQLVSETTRRQLPVLVCGDFNAGPDSDEIRMLTGRSATAVAGLVFYDTWEIAGDGSAGDTWSNRNPPAAVGMFPDRRFDYVLSAWRRLGVVGHPSIASCSVSCLATNATIRPLRRPCRPSLLRRPHSATRGDTIPADGGSCLSRSCALSWLPPSVWILQHVRRRIECLSTWSRQRWSVISLRGGSVAMTTLVLDRTRVNEPPASPKQRRSRQIAMLAASGVVIAAFLAGAQSSQLNRSG